MYFKELSFSSIRTCIHCEKTFFAKLYGQKYTSPILNIDGISINTCACKCKDGVLWLTIVCLITGSNCQNYEDEEEDNQCSLANRTCRNIAQYVPTFQKTNQRANRVAHRAQIHEERWGKHKHVHLHGVNCDTVFRNSKKCGTEFIVEHMVVLQWSIAPQ